MGVARPGDKTRALPEMTLDKMRAIRLWLDDVYMDVTNELVKAVARAEIVGDEGSRDLVRWVLAKRKVVAIMMNLIVEQIEGLESHGTAIPPQA